MMRYLILPLLIMPLMSCEQYDTEGRLTQRTDTIPPVIRLLSDSVETIFLQVSSTTLIANGSSSYTFLPGNSTDSYVDRGVVVLDESNGELRCVDIPLEVSGTVNNKTVGTYTLFYNATDAAGNKAIPVKRLVRVAENKVSFLNGNYDASCTCTAAIKSDVPIISASHYSAYVFASPTDNNHFDLSLLKLGNEFVKPFPLELKNNSITVHFYDRAFNMAGNVSSGALSATKNTFTIETTAYLYSPVTKYHCKNVYTKMEGNFKNSK